MANYKTTLFGALGALGTYLSTITDPAWLGTVGVVVVGLASALLGYFAKDKNVTGGTTPNA
jgi:hypothetical protein